MRLARRGCITRVDNRRDHEDRAVPTDRLFALDVDAVRRDRLSATLEDGSPDRDTARALEPTDARALEPTELPARRWVERRDVVLVLATFLLIAAFAASMLSQRGPGELAALYVLPVMLAGLELGARAGACGAGIAIALLLLASERHSGSTPGGLAASAAVLLIAGMLSGRFSERMRAGRDRQERLLASGLRLARLESVDALPVELAEEVELALDGASVKVELYGMPAVEIGSPTGETLRVPISAHGIDFGSLTLGLAQGRSFSPDDRVVAAKLALQAGVAADNQRLLALERERAALSAELEHTRTRLNSHLRNVSHILDSQEAERREIARQLHDEAAQAMAGVLFGLHVLERDPDPDPQLTRRQLEEVSDIARSTLADLRQLALSVRPPSLDDLGLEAALETIAEREGSGGARQITLHCGGYPSDLTPEIATCLYHVVEDAIQALDGPLSISLNADEDRDTLRIELSGHSVHEHEQLRGKLATAEARLELIGGTLEMSSEGTHMIDVVAELPLHRTTGLPHDGDGAVQSRT
jgi:signal transduction histidine kinase